MGFQREGWAPRVLVVQTRRLGDVLMATPLLRALAQGLAGASVDVLVEPGSAPALVANPHVSSLVWAAGATARLALALRRARYDVAIDAMGKSTSALLTLATRAPVRVGFGHARFRVAYTHCVTPAGLPAYSALQKLALGRALGIESEDHSLQLPGGEAERRVADAWWRDLALDDGPRPIACAPVSRRPDKRWPADRFARVLDRLADRTGRPLLLVHGEGEASQAEAVTSRASRPSAFVRPVRVLPFEALPAALSRCVGYVGNDNGIRHVAVGLGLPTLAVFGRPSPANWTPPDAPQHLVAGGRRDLRALTLDEVEPLVGRFERLVGKGGE